MNRLKTYISLLCFFTVNLMIGQTVVLPDNNLRDKLIADYPSVMQGNELDIAQAGALTGNLDLRNANISDATGIEYFTNITTLSLSGNQLSSLPDISGITGLVNFYATNNNLTTIPDLSSLTLLADFQAMNNQLTDLSGLENCNNLLSLYCSNNNLTDLPALENFPSLKRLVIGENPLENTFNFAVCPDLEELHIHKLNTDTIIGLAQLPKLKVLFAWENKIKDISGLNDNTVLTHCIVFNNLIEDLPSLSNKPNLNTLDINRCKLTFEDLQQVFDAGTPPFFVYDNQKPISVENMTGRDNLTYELSYPIVTPLNTNIYVWKKDGVLLDSSASPVFTYNPLTFQDSGKYVLTVYNTDITSISIRTDTFQLEVLPCLEFSMPYVDILDKDCVEGYTLDLTNAQIAGGTAPFEFEFVNAVYDKIFNNVIIEGIPAGQYEVILQDANNCTATDEIILDKIDGCTPVITPNGDGVADSYYLEHPGTVKIYDVKRYLVNTLEAPASWDGSDQNGAPLDAGYYILVQEGQPTLFITIIR